MSSGDGTATLVLAADARPGNASASKTHPSASKGAHHGASILSHQHSRVRWSPPLLRLACVLAGVHDGGRLRVPDFIWEINIRILHQ
jgi:hypothetical protein